MNPKQLSQELRTATTPNLNRRRWIIGLSLAGTAMAQIVSLYQTGIVKHLPDPPVGPFNADKVDASNYAYKRANTPDGVLMLITYSVTAALAAAGGKDRAEATPWLPVAMALKTLADSGLAIQLGFEEWGENKALCAYCQVATLVSLASVVLAMPEALEALQKLTDGQGERQLRELREMARV